MYASSWIVLISIRGLRKTSNKARETVRFSLKIGGISVRTITTITNPREILLDNLGLQLLKW